jgi:DnaJ domain
MTVARAPSLLLARVLVALMRDGAEALGAIVYRLGRATLRLLWIATVVLIQYAIFVRVTVHVAMPPMIWLFLTGAWLAATALWVLGGLLRYVAWSCSGRAQIRGRAGTPSVGADRIGEWEGAWRRALRYQQLASQWADRGEQRSRENRRQRAGATARSPYEILGVNMGVSQEQLRTAYRELAMRVHPDHNPGFVAEATERFAAIHAAYELQSDPGRRAAYDRRCGAH